MTNAARGYRLLSSLENAAASVTAALNLILREAGMATAFKILTALAGVILVGAPIFDVWGESGYHPVAAGLVALGVLLLVTVLLMLPLGSQKVATQEITVKGLTGDRKIESGWIVPEEVAPQVQGRWKETRPSLFRALYRGKDNRASTSKSVALAWTYSIVWGLLCLLAIRLMGETGGWDALVETGGLQEEYLLLLGGPYAAALIAKYAAVAGDTKTAEPKTDADLVDDAKNLIVDDTGDTDLGDFQYVLFNLVALAFFIGVFLQSPKMGFPDLPDLLIGLALTSAATYAAKKAATGAAGPELASVFPTTVENQGTVDLFGRNLVSQGKAPLVSLDGVKVEEINVLATSSASDHLVFRVPNVPPKEYRLRVTTANGARARTSGQSDFLTLTVM